MTAILGLSFFGGVLMMADTEETLGGDAKSSCEKLHRFKFMYGAQVGTVITGGAGDSHMIECANQELQIFFTDKIKDGSIILESLNDFARNFFEESMRGYQGIAYELVPTFELLIAMNIKGSYTQLFCWRGNRVVMLPAEGHSCIGTGVVQISPMLRDLRGAGRMDTMLFHGVRMMYHAKRAVAGVGGKTEAVALHNDGKTQWIGTDPTQKIEDLAINLDQFINLSVYQNIAAVTPDVLNLEENVQKNLADLPRIMKIYREAYTKILDPRDSEI